jgi:hypothetical protein
VLSFVLQGAIGNECPRVQSASVTGEVMNGFKENSRSLGLLINQSLVCRIMKGRLYGAEPFLRSC